MKRRLIALALCALAVLSLTACIEEMFEISPNPGAQPAVSYESLSTDERLTETTREPLPEDTEPIEVFLDEDGEYTSRDDVALYIHTYGRLPTNFITKKSAEELGWTGGSLEPYAPGRSIGGDRFGNYEGLLPDATGRTYTECDIDTRGASGRGAKRIVFSNDGLIFYTEDHYKSFELLYGGEEG